MTEVLFGLGAAERQRVAALRAKESFFWLDLSLGETTLDDLREALGRANPEFLQHLRDQWSGSAEAL